jgi:hypothetical protein
VKIDKVIKEEVFFDLLTVWLEYDEDYVTMPASFTSFVTTHERE